jgi:hypothetical protein
MKKTVLYFLPAAIALIFIYGFGGDAKWPGGSPGGYIPGENYTISVSVSGSGD